MIALLCFFIGGMFGAFVMALACAADDLRNDERYGEG
jgi:hypothetical protein